MALQTFAAVSLAVVAPVNLNRGGIGISLWPVGVRCIFIGVLHGTRLLLPSSRSVLVLHVVVGGCF
jgi:hypothetical protein